MMCKWKYMTHRNFGGVFSINTVDNTIMDMHKPPEKWEWMKSIGWEIGGTAVFMDESLDVHWVEIPTPNCHLCTDVPDTYEGCFCIEGASWWNR